MADDDAATPLCPTAEPLTTVPLSGKFLDLGGGEMFHVPDTTDPDVVSLLRTLHDLGLPVAAGVPRAIPNAASVPSGALAVDPLPMFEVALTWAGSGVVGTAAFAAVSAAVERWRDRRVGVRAAPGVARLRAAALARWRLEQEFNVVLDDEPFEERQGQDQSWSIAFRRAGMLYTAVVPAEYAGVEKSHVRCARRVLNA